MTTPAEAVRVPRSAALWTTVQALRLAAAGAEWP